MTNYDPKSYSRNELLSPLREMVHFAHSIPPQTVFIPFFRENFTIERFREILQSVCSVESVTVHAKRCPVTQKCFGHYYAFLDICPLDELKSGRDLAKNLRNNITTFVYYRDDESQQLYLELKKFLSKQERLDRGYSGVTLQLLDVGNNILSTSITENFSGNLSRNSGINHPTGSVVAMTEGDVPRYATTSIFDTIDERQHIEQDYEDIIHEVEIERQFYSLWKPSVYLCNYSNDILSC